MYNKSHIFKTKFTNFDMSLYPRNHHHNPVSDYEYICHPQKFPPAPPWGTYFPFLNSYPPTASPGTQ